MGCYSRVAHWARQRLPLHLRRPQPVLVKTSPRPEGKEVEPLRYSEGLYQMPVPKLIKDQVQAHAAHDAEEDRIRVFIDQKTVQDEQLIGMKHQDEFVPPPFVAPRREACYGKMFP